jgi:hypothetical protein
MNAKRIAQQIADLDPRATSNGAAFFDFFLDEPEILRHHDRCFGHLIA